MYAALYRLEKGKDKDLEKELPKFLKLLNETTPSSIANLAASFDIDEFLR